MKRLGWGCLVVGLVTGAAWIWLPRGQRPSLGISDGHLQPCPGPPNCVGSESTDPDHRIDSLPNPGTVEAGQRRLRELLARHPGLRRVEESPGYLRYEAVTPVWRFVDDLEFRFDPASRRIEVRSSSRIGHSDLGTHRRRIGEIRREWGDGTGN